MIKFRCGTCKQKIGVPEEFAGHKVKCPKCEAPLQVPALEPVTVGGGSPDRPTRQQPPDHSSTPISALAQMAAEALNDPVEVPLGDTAPPDIEERAQRQPRSEALGAGPIAQRPQPASAAEPAAPRSDVDALAAAAQSAAPKPKPVAAPPRPVESAPAPYVAPVPQPIHHDPLRHTHRTRMSIPGYWYLMVCGWLCVLAAGGLLIAAVGLAIVDMNRIMGIADVDMASLARAAALVRLLILLAAAFSFSLLGAMALVVRRTAINTWLLRHHFIGH